MVAVLAIGVSVAMARDGSTSTSVAELAEPYEAVQDLPEDVRDEIAKDGISVSPLDSAEVALSADAAVGQARAELPLTSDSKAAVSLVSFTADNFGASSDESIAVKPTYEDRVAWAVLFDDVSVPFMGGYGVDGPAYVRGQLVVFIDAASGEFLLAVSV